MNFSAGISRLFASCLATLVLASSPARAVDVDPAAVEQARNAFIARMVEEHGFDAGELSDILERAEIDEGVLEAISRPAERVLAWHEYRNIFLTDARIDGGVEFWRNHAAQIGRASESFGVAPEMLVAILGVETNYGQRMGGYRIVDSLATLAFAYPPRSGFFTSELEAFFLLAREEGMDPESIRGSYAGAMGAGQFISSSFRAYAVDGNGDGQRDLWEDWEDVLASVANYFKVHGWRQGEIVARQATLSAGRAAREASNSMDLDDTVASVHDAGYAFATGLPDETPVTLLTLEGEGGTEYWAGFHNFRVITRYNRSVMYALAVHQLAQTIRDNYERLQVAAATDAGE